LLSWNSLNSLAQLKLPELTCSAETPWTYLLSWNSLNPVAQLKLPEPSCSAETSWTHLLRWNSLNSLAQLKLPELTCSAETPWTYLLSWNSLNPVAQLKLPETCCSTETPWTLLLNWNSPNPVAQLKLPEPSCSAETPWTQLLSWNSPNPVAQLKLPEPSCSAETPRTKLLGWNSLNPVSQLKLPEPSCSAETPWTELLSWNFLNSLAQLKLPEPSCSAETPWTQLLGGRCFMFPLIAYCSKAAAITGLAIVGYNATGIVLAKFFRNFRIISQFLYCKKSCNVPVTDRSCLYFIWGRKLCTGNQMNWINCKELITMFILGGRDRLNEMDGTQTLSMRFYKCDSCVGRATICDRETAAFNISKILWGYHRFETLLQGSMQYWKATDLLHITAVRFHSHGEFCLASRWQKHKTFPSESFYIIFRQFKVSCRFTYEKVDCELVFLVRSVKICDTLNNLFLFLSDKMVYVSTREQQITKPCSEPRSSSSKIL